jgi:hypothetical protein
MQIAIPNCKTVFFQLIRFGQWRFEIAPPGTPAYSNCLMGQQHRVKAKRQRRKAYRERKRVAAAAQRRTSKARSKKTTAEAAS